MVPDVSLRPRRRGAHRQVRACKSANLRLVQLSRQEGHAAEVGQGVDTVRRQAGFGQEPAVVRDVLPAVKEQGADLPELQVFQLRRVSHWVRSSSW